GGKVGVDYGTDANNLPSPDQVSDLVKKHNIQYLRIYDSDPKVLKSLSNTGIELIVGVHNDDLSKFQFQSYVDSWVKNSILPYYPATKITDISVGVEVTDSPDAANLAVPAMRNVVSALKKVGLQDRIKVSTPLSFGVLSKSYPPSDGAFDGSHDNVLGPLLDFLEENQSPFMVNLYPFYAIGDSSLDAVLFKSPSSIFVDPNTGFSYKNIFDAQLDAVHFALAKLNNGDSSLDYVLFKSSSSIFVDGNTCLSYNNIFDAQLDVLHFALAHRNFSRMKIIVTETGWPTRGSPYASIDNAQTYNTNLIRHVMDGPGTPAWPHEELVVYIFSLFNENLKQGPETERNFGIFYPDMTSVYNLGFPDKGGRSWCIASSQALDSDLQYLLIWACILGKANCSAIQPGQQCFEPDTL
ncbi:hypothetical protein Godav_007809, partial [Gossypium davidsonii]|nr:hypothetical protein [Gossypium davidsonii]